MPTAGQEVPAELRYLLDAATSQAKTRGHGVVTLAHVGLALLADHRDAVADVLPAAEVLERALAGTPRSFDPPAPGDDVLAALRDAAGSRPVRAVADAVAAWSAAAGAAGSGGPTGAVDVPAGVGAPPPPPDAGAQPASDAAEPTSATEPAPSAAGPVIPETVARYVEPVAPRDDLLDRADAVQRVIAVLSQRQRVTPVVVAPEGAGRTAFLGALAAGVAALAEPHPLAGRHVVHVRAEPVVGARRGDTLRGVVDSVGDDLVLGVDDLEVLCALGSGGGADLQTVAVLRGAVTREDRHLVLLLAQEFLDSLRAVDRELMAEVEVVHLAPLEGESLRRVVQRHAVELAAHHGMTIPPEVVAAALEPARADEPLAQPSLAVLRLDRAASAARQAGSVARPEDAFAGAAPQHRAFDAAAARHRLGETIVGQDHALDRVVERLLVTRSRLDLRPDRPDGVFLFVGPTGVGKTATARALAEAVFGNEDAVVQLDMSEYAEPHTVSRLVGSPPGYVGSTDPESWLTTKIRTNDNVVLVLDEIEKAHPQVWNTFLQVFDAGRLTDGLGRTASFANTVVVLTSNIGAEAYSNDAIGFGDRTPSAEQEAGGVLRAVRSRMAPELLNRLDDVLVFSPLDPGAAESIARRQLTAVTNRMRERGLKVEVTDDVVARVVDEGFSREYGARPLHRAIERLVIGPVAAQGPGSYRPDVAPSGITWRPTTDPDVGVPRSPKVP